MIAFRKCTCPYCQICPVVAVDASYFSYSPSLSPKEAAKDTLIQTFIFSVVTLFLQKPIRFQDMHPPKH
ncbi:unnamed protein product [Lactuca virosa]|uniref:Uncharacterized protein n=1 Tax=Lactuca virosa TaxID=75947 RepID=A0AAU9PXI1_9ASTR|nr:unnamed protein product [Lactuca virosa]